MHLCVLRWHRSATRMVPGAFARSLIDEKPAAVGGIPFCYPARGKIVIGVGRRRDWMRGRWTIKGTFTCALIYTDFRLVSHDGKRMPHPRIEQEDDEYVLEPTVVWRVPLLDPARWEATISTLWWTRGARRLMGRLVRWGIALTVRLALVRRTGGLGARSLLLMGICLGRLIEIVHAEQERK